MRSGVLSGVCVAALAMCLCLPQPCEAQWDDLVGPILSKLSGLWHDDEVNFMGHDCRFSRSPTFHSWELYHKGKFWCPGWAPFSGSSRTLSRSGSLEHATRDFVRKAFENGLITQEDASLWLSESG